MQEENNQGENVKGEKIAVVDISTVVTLSQSGSEWKVNEKNIQAIKTGEYVRCYLLVPDSFDQFVNQIKNGKPKIMVAIENLNAARIKVIPITADDPFNIYGSNTRNFYSQMLCPVWFASQIGDFRVLGLVNHPDYKKAKQQSLIINVLAGVIKKIAEAPEEYDKKYVDKFLQIFSDKEVAKLLSEKNIKENKNSFECKAIQYFTACQNLLSSDELPEAWEGSKANLVKVAINVTDTFRWRWLDEGIFKCISENKSIHEIAMRAYLWDKIYKARNVESISEVVYFYSREINKSIMEKAKECVEAAMKAEEEEGIKKQAKEEEPKKYIIPRKNAIKLSIHDGNSSINYFPQSDKQQVFILLDVDDTLSRFRERTPVFNEALVPVVNQIKTTYGDQNVHCYFFTAMAFKNFKQEIVDINDSLTRLDLKLICKEHGIAIKKIITSYTPFFSDDYAQLYDSFYQQKKYNKEYNKAIEDGRYQTEEYKKLEIFSCYLDVLENVMNAILQLPESYTQETLNSLQGIINSLENEKINKIDNSVMKAKAERISKFIAEINSLLSKDNFGKDNTEEEWLEFKKNVRETLLAHQDNLDLPWLKDMAAYIFSENVPLISETFKRPAHINLHKVAMYCYTYKNILNDGDKVIFFDDRLECRQSLEAVNAFLNQQAHGKSIILQTIGANLEEENKLVKKLQVTGDNEKIARVLFYYTQLANVKFELDKNKIFDRDFNKGLVCNKADIGKYIKSKATEICRREAAARVSQDVLIKHFSEAKEIMNKYQVSGFLGVWSLDVKNSGQWRSKFKTIVLNLLGKAESTEDATVCICFMLYHMCDLNNMLNGAAGCCNSLRYAAWHLMLNLQDQLLMPQKLMVLKTVEACYFLEKKSEVNTRYNPLIEKAAAAAGWSVLFSSLKKKIPEKENDVLKKIVGKSKNTPVEKSLKVDNSSWLPWKRK